jgi:hypothetical protein
VDRYWLVAIGRQRPDWVEPQVIGPDDQDASSSKTDSDFPGKKNPDPPTAWAF